MTNKELSPHSKHTFPLSSFFSAQKMTTIREEKSEGTQTRVENNTTTITTTTHTSKIITTTKINGANGNKK
ncbi:MAG: hypothetical protein QWI73_06070 [Alphaproteobacteria bacterium]|nr:hypothetical protein [Alphaproteobacteria bacterium]